MLEQISKGSRVSKRLRVSKGSPTSKTLHAALALLMAVCLAGVLRGEAGVWAARASWPALSPPSASGCAPLPPPSGRVIHVTPAQAGQLGSIVHDASAGDTISLADGTYALHGVYLRFDTPGVTLRSDSGEREAVVLDGGYETTEIVQVAASGITIADLTLRRAYYHPIHVVAEDDSDTLDTLIYNVHLIDPGQQALKINQNAAMTHFADDGIVACSRLELTDAGRPRVWEINGSCYTGGVDAHQARGWTIRDNEIEGFWCASGLSEHGIHLWRGCRDTVVERNVLRDNARGIGFGLATTGPGRTYADDPCPSAEGGYVDHYGGVIRNNAISASRSALFASEYGFDCGICLWQACGAQVVHNTVASTQAPFSSIEWRFEYTDVDVANNLVTHPMRDRGGTARLAGNLEEPSLALFVDGPGGDLHLSDGAAAAIDAGVPLAAGLCDDDMDGDARPIGPARDVGADEYGVPPPAAVTDLWVTGAVAEGGTLTVTLRWTAPTGAVTSTVRYAAAPIDAASWGASSGLAAPFAAAAPGTVQGLTAPLPYSGGTVYFALASQNAQGEVSDPSNNAFWPVHACYLPLAIKDP